MATQYTPYLQLPYPQAGDPPRGWEQIQDLAEAVDGQARTTWEALLAGTGGAIDRNAFYRLVFRRVNCAGAMRRIDGGEFPGKGVDTDLGFLAVAARPAKSITFTVALAGTPVVQKGTPGRIVITADTGAITFSTAADHCRVIYFDTITWDLNPPGTGSSGDAE
jgi:hypothetical protein